MTTTTDTGVIMTYFLFMSIMLFLTPAFDPTLFNITQQDFNSGAIDANIEAGIFQIAINFISDLILRFSVLLSITTSGTLVGNIVGIVVGAYTVGSFIVLARLIAEALP